MDDVQPPPLKRPALATVKVVGAEEGLSSSSSQLDTASVVSRFLDVREDSSLASFEDPVEGLAITLGNGHRRLIRGSVDSVAASGGGSREARGDHTTGRLKVSRTVPSFD